MGFIRFIIGVALLAGVGIGVFVAFSMFAQGFKENFDKDHLPEVDAIVCLAGAKGRIAAASELWNEYLLHGKNPPKLYISGMFKNSDWGVFLNQVSPTVRDKIRPDQVILETRSLNTVQNASVALNYAAQLQWKSIILMTSRYHMPRAEFIFRETFKSVSNPITILPFGIAAEHMEEFEKIRVNTVEVIKTLYYRSFWTPEKATSTATEIGAPAVSAPVVSTPEPVHS